MRLDRTEIESHKGGWGVPNRGRGREARLRGRPSASILSGVTGGKRANGEKNDSAPTERARGSNPSGAKGLNPNRSKRGPWKSTRSALDRLESQGKFVS